MFYVDPLLAILFYPIKDELLNFKNCVLADINRMPKLFLDAFSIGFYVMNCLSAAVFFFFYEHYSENNIKK